MTFRVGMEVEVVQRGPWEPDGEYDDFGAAEPMPGNVYVIDGLDHDGEDLWLSLVGFEDEYTAYSFRPVQKRKTDISCFTALLNTNKVREEA